MDALLKAKWIEALRSGEYQQAHETLHDGAGYCCLGVLCKVAGLEIRDDGGGVVGRGHDHASFDSYAPIFDIVGGYELSHQLSMRNDGLHVVDRVTTEGGHKFSFAEIADYIEMNIPASA